MPVRFIKYNGKHRVMRPLVILLGWIALIIADVIIGLSVIKPPVDSIEKIVAGVAMIAIIPGSMWIVSGFLEKVFKEEEKK